MDSGKMKIFFEVDGALVPATLNVQDNEIGFRVGGSGYNVSHLGAQALEELRVDLHSKGIDYEVHRRSQKNGGEIDSLRIPVTKS